MVEAMNLLRFVMCYTLCAIYSSWIGFGVLLAFVFKRSSRFWEVKKRTVKPALLSNNDYGEHKFMTVNVSDISARYSRVHILCFHFFNRASKSTTWKRVTLRSS